MTSLSVEEIVYEIIGFLDKIGWNRVTRKRSRPVVGESFLLSRSFAMTDDHTVTLWRPGDQ
jgi:hypothetical protein